MFKVVKMISTRPFILLLSTLTLSKSELIQLENKDHITCITDQLTSSIIIWPPIVQNSRNTSVLLEDDNMWNDWFLKNSKEVIAPLVKDSRWETFQTIYTDEVFINLVKCLPFSVFYSPHVRVRMFTHDEPIEPPKVKKRREIMSDWKTSSIYSSDRKSLFSVKGISSAKVYWKIHDYELRWANTTSETPTIINIETPELSCVTLYVYSCLNCVLKVNADGSDYSFRGKIRSWESQEIKVELGSNITLNRTTLNGSSEGEWGIDIRKCPVVLKSNKTVYKVDLRDDVEHGVNRICRVLPTNENSSIFTCKPGSLGKKCDVHCEDFLGDDAKYCEKHKICSSISDCVCAWGYHGASCEETCPEGKWGLSCQQSCRNCKMCNAKTGSCSGSSSIGIGLEFVALIVCGILVVLS